LPDYKNINDKQHKGLLGIIASGLGGLFVAGAIYGGGLWLALIVLRRTGTIENIISYRNCLYLAYIYVCIRAYDNQVFGKK
jgi:hypothetical protein